MRILSFKPVRMSSVGAVLIILAGCTSSGSQPALGPSRPIEQHARQSDLNAQSLRHLPTLAAKSGVAVTVHPDHRRSWMAPDAKKHDLLYIADYGTNDVYVFSYRQGKLKGRLTGFNGPQGECVDKASNVWITNTYLSEIVEYAHGGTSPVAILRDPGEYPVGCSVDPTTGNLAVTNICDAPSCGEGNLVVYRKAQGKPKAYTDPYFYKYYFCGFDNKGNLFVDGGSSGGTFQFAELPRRSSTLGNILIEANILFPGGVQWDGRYVSVGDQDVSGGGSYIYQVQVSGSIGTVAGKTELVGAYDIVQFWIQGKKLIGPDAYYHDVGFYNYPAGGTATKTLTGFNTPYGSVVSKGKQ
jgi:hypothetical protein